jgi:RecA-family ATPase
VALTHIRLSRDPHTTDGLRFYTFAEMMQRPTPKFLVHDMLARRSFALLYGPSGAGKSFFALHLAICVALGHECFGHRVHQGPVVYVAAEGAEGLSLRQRAWVQVHELGLDEVVPLTFLTSPINLIEHDAVRDFSDELAAQRPAPVLVIIDTLARSMVGGDENTALHMGLAIDGITKLIRRIGCTLLLIHHTGRTGTAERGSTSLRGALDTSMYMHSVNKTTLALENKKQKNAAPFAKMQFTPRDIMLDEVDESRVLERQPNEVEMTKRQRGVLVLVGKKPRTFSDLWGRSGLTKTAFQRSLAFLVKSGLVHHPGQHKGGLYLPTVDGKYTLGVKG